MGYAFDANNASRRADSLLRQTRHRVAHMFKTIGHAAFKAQGWTIVGQDLITDRRCVVIAAPHTSNWDALITMAAFDRLDLPVRFTIKDAWMKFPLNLVIEPAGGIGIDRRPREESGERPSMVEAMVQLFVDHPGDLALIVTPEGTRSRSTRWKSGFYHVAKHANVPIVLGYLDYEKREAGVGKVMHPSGDFEADMREIAAFYHDIPAKHPERFSVDLRFAPPSSPSDDADASPDDIPPVVPPVVPVA